MERVLGVSGASNDLMNIIKCLGDNNPNRSMHMNMT